MESRSLAQKKDKGIMARHLDFLSLNQSRIHNIRLWDIVRSFVLGQLAHILVMCSGGLYRFQKL